ncbi:hypothetical protein GCK72_021364 [Caenorhabditis remanei]|uniref:L-Fucosyltransferase n=1 Tax=Caenorhabditis remanei TaxID=31234 RepID=A0A6A5GHY2_CAERE|nr:hypothetical protein GCK72_021364 [Caenorhabditis remanei]KAF1754800.1 hypothetical protein GCK72_021364 [Caenorhabditis remanei]
MIKDTNLLIPGLLDKFVVVNGTVPSTVTQIEFGMKCCIFEEPDRLKNITEQYLHLGGHHYHSWKYFPRLRSKLIRFLKVPTTNFPDLPKSEPGNYISCIHIRRTDFNGTGFHMAGNDFILNSIKYVEREEKGRIADLNVTTVFFGDDLEFMEALVNETRRWEDENLRTVSFISKNTPPDDILYARYHCDAVLITSPHSTFGWWMGFLSKGNMVYYNDIKFTDDQSMVAGNFEPDDYFPPHWKPIRYGDVNNLTVVESLK